MRNRRVNYTYCEDKWNFVLVVQGENILISDHYWNSHGYYLHYSDIALYKMKICKDTPQTSPWNTHMKGKTGGKTNCETFFMKSYRNNLTTYITERMSNSVQYAHLVGWGTKLKMSHCWGLMQICLLQKLFKLAVLMYK